MLASDMDIDPNQSPPPVPEPIASSPVVPGPVPPANVPAPVPPAPEMQKGSFISKLKALTKRPVVLIVAGVVLAALIYLYFFFLPNMFASNYLKGTKQPYESYKASVDKTIGSFGRPAFVSSDTTAANDKKDLEYAHKTIEESKTAGTSFDAKVSKLTVLPGTSGGSKVKEAVRQRESYQAYRETSSEFLKNYLALVVYFEKLNALQIKQEASGEELEKELASANSAAALAVAFNKMAAEIDKLSSDLRNIEAPDYLREIHNQYLKLIDQSTQILKAMAKSLTAGDVEALEDDYAEFAKFAEEAAKQTEKFIDQLQNHSILREQINRLKGTNVKAV